MNFIKKYQMELYSLERSNLVSWMDKIPKVFQFIDVTDAILRENKSFCAKHYKDWKRNLKKGAKGVFVLNDGEIVGYGWLKTNRANDPFYCFQKNTAYLSEFYVDPDFRGKRILAAMISFLVINNFEYQRFYVSAYSSNKSSINGLIKCGFSHLCTLTFLRVAKVTLNKHKLSIN